MTVLVTGATGAVGRRLVTELLLRGRAVRALTRRPADAALPEEVDVVAGDLTDASTLHPGLFAGIESVFVFPVGDVSALIDGATGSGIGRFVVLSSLAVSAEFPRDEHSVSRLHHRAVEDAVTSRTDGWAVLRPGTFADNLLAWAPAIRYGGTIRAPYLDSAQAPIHEYDVADALAALLTQDGHRGRTYEVTGPAALTRRDQVETIAAAIGRPVPVEEISPEEFRQESGRYIPEPVMRMLLDYWHDTVMQPDRPRPTEALTRHPGRSLSQWARDHIADFAPAKAR